VNTQSGWRTGVQYGTGQHDNGQQIGQHLNQFRRDADIQALEPHLEQNYKNMVISAVVLPFFLTLQKQSL